MNTYDSDNSGLKDNLARFTKETPMPVLTECENCLAISGQNTEETIAEASGGGMRPKITPPMLQHITSLPPTRIVKIFEVREQLARGTYDIDERLDAVLDRILADIKT